MTPERWQKIKEIFAGAAALAAEERAAYLDATCGADHELRLEVESLLASEDREVSLVDGDLLAAVAPLLAHRPREARLSGRRIGSYRVLREIGRGGMAVVYAAIRDDGHYRQQVAIKLIRQGMDTGRMIARFRQERQILANLEHPNIARLLDGGVTAEGLPYLVMELIEGEPIDAYCQRRQSTLAESLHLFRTVCAAVHYAHGRLVIHRDLKPSNILVTAEGIPKLLDFGIAKLLELDAERAKAEITIDGPRPMTPEYASPEQILEQPVTTASDVYALGVLLYRLLTGRRPYRIDQLSHSQIESVICEQIPERPSIAVQRSLTADELPEAAQLHRRQHSELHRRLRGDLDNIVMMAMRKEPERRYGSVEQLSEDLRRYLEGLPVIARENTLSYRATKFAQRHRVGVAAALLVFLFLISGIITTTWQMRAAQQERLTAQTVSTFLVDLFELSDPEKARGRDVTARLLLDRSVDDLDQLADQPVVQAELMDTIGRVYLELGLLDDAEPLLERAFDLRQGHLTANDPALADSQANVAALYEARARFAAAESLYRSALSGRQKTLADDDERLAESENSLGKVLELRGRLDEAEQILRRALERQRRVFGNEHPTIALTLNNLALVLRGKSQLPEAVELYRRALTMGRKLLGDDHPEVAIRLNNLASVLCKIGEQEEALLLFDEARQLESKVLGDRHWSLATTQSNLAICRRILGDFAGAEALFLQSLELRRKALGPDHPEVASSLNNLGRLLFDRGELEQAERHFRQALALYRQHGDLLQAAGTRNNLAAVLSRRGRLAEAAEMYQEVLEKNRERYGEAHENVARSRHNLGEVSRRNGQWQAAEEHFRAALETYEQLFGTEHLDVANSHHSLAHVMLTTGRMAEAEAHYGVARELRQRILGEQHHDVASSALGQGRALLILDRHTEAERRLRQALTIYQGQSDDRRQPGAALAESLLGRCLTGLGRFPEAQPLLVSAHAFLERTFGSEHRWTAEARAWLLDLYEQSGRSEAADRLRRSAAPGALRENQPSA